MPSGQSSAPQKGIFFLRMHHEDDSTYHALRLDHLFLVFGKDVKGGLSKGYWKDAILPALPAHIKAQVATLTAEAAAKDPRIAKWSTVKDPSLNSCHGIIWSESGGQVKLLVLNARGKPPKSPLKYKTEREEWKTAVPADVPVTSAWSVPSDIQYITVTSRPDTCWMKVRWTGAAAPHLETTAPPPSQ